MTSLDELDLFTAPGSTVVIEREPRKCRRHEWAWAGPTPEDGERCRRCGRLRDVTASRRGRNNRSRGKRIERVAMRAAGVHTGNANKADDGQSVDGMFAYQAKSRQTAAFPGWAQAELDKLRTAHGNKVPVLVVIEAPGPGRKPRSLAIVDWSDWLDLHVGEAP